jgi:hypothetical protein
MIAPSSFHSLAHVDGELGTARGATEAQCIYTYNWMLSTILEGNILQTTGKIVFCFRLFNTLELRSKVFTSLFNCIDRNHRDNDSKS